MSPDLSSRLLDYLRIDLEAPALRLTEPLAAIRGGYDTQIFSFRLEGGPPASSGPLILRLLSARSQPTRVLRERAVQDAVAALGYPAPVVFSACADPEALGAAFLVMERKPGRPMLDAKRFGVAPALVAAQLRLHDLDAAPVLRATDAAGAGDVITVGGLLVDFAARVAGPPFAGLEPAMDWLLAHRPAEPARRVICHGDFHPGNILVSAGEVTGVLDWPNAVVGDPAYDVAATKALLELTPVEVLDVRAAVRPLIDVARRLLLRRYLAGYRRRRSLDPSIIEYYEAVACMRGLIRVAEVHRAAARGGPAVGRLDASPYGRRAAARFARITGIAPTLLTAAGASA